MPCALVVLLPAVVFGAPAALICLFSRRRSAVVRSLLQEAVASVGSTPPCLNGLEIIDESIATVLCSSKEAVAERRLQHSSRKHHGQ